MASGTFRRDKSGQIGTNRDKPAREGRDMSGQTGGVRSTPLSRFVPPAGVPLVPDDGELFHPGTQCYLRKLFYDFQKRKGTLYMGEDSCCDMGGTIAMFQAIDPDVVEIQTARFPDVPDTNYRKTPDGKWIPAA